MTIYMKPKESFSYKLRCSLFSEDELIIQEEEHTGITGDPVINIAIINDKDEDSACTVFLNKDAVQKVIFILETILQEHNNE